MSDYIVFYRNSDYTGRAYTPKTRKFTDIVINKEFYQIKKRYEMLGTYEYSDENLIKFNNQFLDWVDEIKHNDIFSFDYLKYSSHESVCVDMFKKLCHGKYEDMEDIDGLEFRWIEKCNNGGLIYHDKGRHEDCHGYDYKRQYPGILGTEDFHIPTKRGTQRTITELTYPKIETGYYKVEIRCKNSNFNKAFAYSQHNVYTNTSLMFAFKYQKEYNVIIELIQEKNNCYTYGFLEKKSDKIKSGVKKSSFVFGKWYEYLYALGIKFPKNRLVKYMTSALWGRLCEYNRLFVSYEQIKEKKIDHTLDYNRKHDYFIRNVKKNKQGIEILELINTNKPFYYNIARIKPFLISKSRSLIGTIAMKYIKDVVRIHTDNVTFNKEHDDVIYETKTMKLVKEDKTTGDITFKFAGCYMNHTTGDKTNNYKLEDEEDEGDEYCLFE